MKKREAKQVRFAEPTITTPEPEAVETRESSDRDVRPGLYWPKGKPKPTRFRRRLPAPVPCENCDRVKTDFGTRAVVCDRGVSEAAGKAYLSCRCCGHRFTMPLEKGEAP